MYVCMHVCMYVYVSQGDFRLMSFTAGRCGTPLIFKAIQDVHLCMYVCMYACVYVYICFTR